MNHLKIIEMYWNCIESYWAYPSRALAVQNMNRCVRLNRDTVSTKISNEKNN